MATRNSPYRCHEMLGFFNQTLFSMTSGGAAITERTGVVGNEIR